MTERERKRIAADLHDDLGAKLLTIVHTPASGPHLDAGREALEEMRLSVRGLTGKPVHLADALADWRAEVVMRLGQANIEATGSRPPTRTPTSRCRPALRPDHPHPARVGQQHHQAQRGHARHHQRCAVHGGRFHPDRAGQRLRHPGRIDGKPTAATEWRA